MSTSDTIELDGVEIPPIERTRLFLFHKPAGVVTTNRDPEGRRTVFDVLPKDLPRLMTIGRLDINTEGLLLLTNDGGLARVLELPATGWLQALPRRASTARSTRRRWPASRTASPSTASSMAASRRRSTASRAPTPG